MANSYTFTGPGSRWTVGDPTSKDRLDIARINIDHIYEALNVIMSTNAAEGLKGVWTDPLIVRASASCYGSLWLDNTDTGNIIWRTRTGTTRAAVLPANIADGVMITVGAFS